MDKYLGCLIGAAAGDALGAPTETRNPARIKEYFEGEVRDFVIPPNDVFARGNQPGQVTDDFSLAYVTLLTLLDEQEITTASATKSLVEWASDKYPYLRLAGPTTQATIRRLQDPSLVNTTEFVVASDNAKATNGLAMKIAPIALLAHGNIEKALTMTLTIGMISHHNNIAIAAGGAVASSVAKAMDESSSFDEVLLAGIEGAIVAEEMALAQGADWLAGSNVARRIEVAINIAKTASTKEQGKQDLIDLIGTGILAYESIPTAYGLLELYKDEPLEALFAAVNIGNDTDTIATIVGGILGAFYGTSLFPSRYLMILYDANDYDLVSLAKRIQQWSH